jgi:hypothetical protein
MPAEYLNVVNESSDVLDAQASNAVKGLALAFAGLEIKGNLLKESVVSVIYNGIGTGVGVNFSDSTANTLYQANIKTPQNSLVFPGYKGYDVYVNEIISSINALGGSSSPEFLALKASLNAICASAAINNLSIYQTSGLINSTFNYYAQIYPFAAYQLVPTGFTYSILSAILAQPYQSILSDISSYSPQDSEVEVYYYPYYITTGLFSQQIDYQRMGDSEAQYYYVSGKIIYDNAPPVSNPCQQITVTGNDGSIFYLYKNLPCVDPNNNIEPVNNLAFYRKFPDAPNASGAENLAPVYEQFNVVASPQFHNYRTGLFSDPALQDLLGGINSDLPVFYGIDTIETGQVPQAPNSTGYSSSHIGGTNFRWRITGYLPPADPNSQPTPLYGFVQMTGFKIIPIFLDKNVWGAQYDAIRTNPDVPLDSKLIRALNLTEHLSSGNVGGPIVSDTSFELPCLYLTEEFYNKTLKTFQTGSLYVGTYSNQPATDDLLRPVIQGQFLTGLNGSGKNYVMGDTGNYPKLTFAFYVSNTGLSGVNSYFAKRGLGMGDGGVPFSFSGQKTGYNIGLAYQDFYVLSGNKIIDTNLFFQSFSNGIVGQNGDSVITYIDGFDSTSTQKVYGYSESGDLITYNYFYPGTNNAPYSGWPAPFPELQEGKPILVSQPKENYFPRFSVGPYSAQYTSFLYPSASGVNTLYPKGFPLQVEINLSVSEEIARRYYSKRVLSSISGRGGFQILDIISQLPNSTFNNAGNFTTNLPFATQVSPDFHLDETYSLAGNLVPNYWVDDNFVNVYAEESALHNMLSSNCSSGSYTGSLGSKDIPATNGIISWGNKNSGFYVIEYETGSYKGPPSQGQYDYYRIQDDGDYGLYVSFSSGLNLIKLPFTTQKFTYSPTPDEIPSHYSFFHSGGAISISGWFGAGYSDSTLKLRLEKDCPLAAPFYFKYGGTDINSAGWKYLQNDHCLRIDVYPSGTISQNAIRGFSLPNFSQGVRLYNVPQWCCPGTYGCTNVPMHEMIVHQNSNGGTKYYSDMSGYDSHGEFHTQNSQNLTLTLTYTLPSFSIADRFTHSEYANASLVIPDLADCNGNSASGSPIAALTMSGVNYLLNRSGQLIPSGADPIWFEVVGGNSGVSGGYHSKGIIGDGWIGMSKSGYGVSPICDGNNILYYLRTPQNDSFVVEFNFRPSSEVSLHTRALTCTPGYFDHDGFQNYDLTGIERAHRIPYSSKDLLSIFNAFISTGFQEYSFDSTDYLFPKPNWDYASVCSGLDSNGNLTTKGVIAYWTGQIIANTGLSVTGYAYRERSRLNFKINSIKINKYGPQPVDSHANINLTGRCLISGEFGYDSQAESAVFTEGIYLKDSTPNAPLTGFYAPSFVSDVLYRISGTPSGSPTSPIDYAPSKCVTRKNIAKILPSGNVYIPHLTMAPYYYNRFIVPALSDLTILNPDSQYAGFEQLLQDDGVIYPNTTFALSATVAQHVGTAYESFLNIPDASKLYYVEDIKQFYDSSVTDAVINSGYFITSGRGPKVFLSQKTDSTGFLGPVGASYKLNQLGLYSGSGYADYSPS